MANPKSFPLVRGRSMRATRLDGCGNPIAGPDNMVVTEGFVSVALTAQITEPEEITVVNASGATCVRDTGCPEFNGYGVELTFCEVNPCLFSMMTGQPSVTNALGEVVGFKMNSDVSVCDIGIALEVWSGVPGVACSGDAGAFGYLLLPFLQGGVIGDFSIENAAVTFTVTGMRTKDGNAWGVGPYNVVLDEGGDPAQLPQILEENDHLYAVFTEVGPPEATDGCAELVIPAPVASTEAIAGAPGTWAPSSSIPPETVADLIASSITATPTTAWTTGQYVQTQEDGALGRAYWDGTDWVQGVAP